VRKSSCFLFVLLCCFLASSVAAQEIIAPAAGGGVRSAGLPAMTGISPQALQSLSPQAIHNLPADVRAQLPAGVAGQLGQGEAAGAGGQAETEMQQGAPPRRSGSSFSKLETQYRSGYASSLAGDLHQFGYEIFNGISLKSSRLAVPGQDYVLGPGDKLRIRVWGTEIDAEFTGMVERNGTVNVPRIGIVPVTGVKFGQVEAVIRQEAEKYIQGININVSLDELRSVEVYVVGAVRNPGLHLAPAFSTVFDGLLAGGGIQKSGTLRAVALYRDGKLFREVDLYDLLLKGERGADVALENRDVIFVPRLARTAAVTGAVREEGIFELKGENTLGDLLQLTGGVLPQGFTGRIYLRRYLRNAEFVVRDIDTRLEQEWRAIPLENGDLLELQSLSSAMPRVVRLEGHVWSPDVFQFEPGLTLQQVLVSTELLKPGAVMEFALLHRYDPQTTRYQVQRLPLEKVLQKQVDLALAPFDRIEILSREEVGITEQVAVQGAVWQPSHFAHRPGLTLADALALAGGPKFGARVGNMELSRQQIEGDQAVTKHFTLDLARDGGFLLQPFDYLLVPVVKDAVANKTVTLTGEVKYPGTYRIGDGERLSDLIARAGGFQPEAYFFGAKYTSEHAQQIQQQSIDKMVQELELAAQRALTAQAQTAVSEEAVQAAQAGQASLQMLLAKMQAIKAEGRVAIKLADLGTFRGSAYDFELRDGDTLHVPRQPNFVATVGSVYSPNAYLFEPNRSVRYYLEKSGGPTKTADDKHIYVLRANGEVIAKEQGGRLLSRFESHKLMPGDTIVVPENLERVPHLRLVRDIADIMFKIATTAGVVIAIL
jgi:polysaccharide biosynthesis/export protein